MTKHAVQLVCLCLVLSSSARTSGVAALPDCKRVEGSTLLSLSPAELRASGLARVARDREVASSLLEALEDLVPCVTTNAGARPERRKVAAPDATGSESIIQSSGINPCLQKAIDRVTRIIREDEEVQIIRVGAPLNLVVARIRRDEEDLLATAPLYWHRSNDWPPAGPPASVPRAEYESCSSRGSEFELVVALAGAHVRFEIVRGDEDIPRDLLGIWHSVDSDIELEISGP